MDDGRRIRARPERRGQPAGIAERAAQAGRPGRGGQDGQYAEGGGSGIPPSAYCPRSEEHTSELQSLMRISYAVFCLKKKKSNTQHKRTLLLTKTNTIQ